MGQILTETVICAQILCLTTSFGKLYCSYMHFLSSYSILSLPYGWCWVHWGRIFLDLKNISQFFLKLWSVFVYILTKKTTCRHLMFGKFSVTFDICSYFLPFYFKNDIKKRFFPDVLGHLYVVTHFALLCPTFTCSVQFSTESHRRITSIYLMFMILKKSFEIS